MKQLIQAMPTDRKVWEDKLLWTIMQMADVTVSEADLIIYESDIIEYCFGTKLSPFVAAQTIMVERSMKLGTL